MWGQKMLRKPSPPIYNFPQIRRTTAPIHKTSHPILPVHQGDRASLSNKRFLFVLKYSTSSPWLFFWTMLYVQARMLPTGTQYLPSGAYFEDIPKMTASATKNEKLVTAKQMKVFLCLCCFRSSLGVCCSSGEKAKVVGASWLVEVNLAEAWFFGGGGGRKGTTFPGT